MDVSRGLATPLVTSYGAPASQQVMSPTQGTPALEHGTRAFSGSTPPLETGHSGAEGFEPMAAGRAFGGAGQHESLQDSGEAPRMSTTMEGGVRAHLSVPVPSITPGESSGLQANTDRSGTGTEHGRRDGEAASGGVVAEDFHEGFVTPRSQQGLPTIAEMVEGIPSASQFMSGIGSFFRVARTEVMQVPSAWQNTHDTPPRSTTLSRDSPEGQRALGERSLGSHSSSPPTLGLHGTPTSFGPPPERDGQLLSQDVLQRMQALQQRAPLLYGYPPDRPASRSNSSSLPQEAIQAEVARQLAGFDQRAQVQDAEILRLRRELDEAARREQEMREHVRREREVANNAPLTRVTQSLDEAPQPIQVSPPQVTQVPAPVTHQVSDFAAQAVEALRTPAQTAAAATSGFWSNLWSGLQGSQQLPSTAMPPSQANQASMQCSPPERVGQRVADHSAQVPTSQVSQAYQASGSGTQGPPLGGALPPVTPGENHGIASGNPALDAVLLGVQQLQALQAQNLSSRKKADAPEQVKTGITAFPKLAPPNPAGGSLEFQDWLQLIAGLMGDFSDSSQLWWSGVVQVTKDAYERWVTSSPIERLRVEPDDRPEITEGKWGRVNARACAMLMDALDPVVKADLIARKANRSASHILFRLYTTYQPGGTGERNLVLSNLQNPQVIPDATARVAALRDWGRWYQRCIDFGMNLPDPMVLVGALNSMTKPVISKNTEVTWRTEMVKSTLQLHARPTAEAVTAYHRHLLAEFEALATSQVPKKGGNQPPNLALKAMDGAAGGASGGQGGGAKGGGKGKIPCKYFLSQKGCRYGGSCKNVHSMNELSKGDRFKKCLNCGSEEHRAKDCDRPNKAGKSGPKDPNLKPITQIAQVTPSPSAASTSQSVVQATPLLSPDLLHQAAEMYRQLQALHAQATHPLPLQAPQATQPLPLPGRQRLTAAIKHITTVHQTFGHHLHHASELFCLLPCGIPNLGCPNPPSQAENGGLGGPEARFKGENGHICPKSTFSARELGFGPEEGLCPKPIAYALLDSGATHPMRQAKDQGEWDEAVEVQVSLARQFNIDAPHAVWHFAPPAAREGWQCATHCANGSRH